MTTSVADEGGFAPRLPSNESAIQGILQAIEIAGYTAGEHVGIALDAAASEFYKDGKYTWDKKPHTAAELADVYVQLSEKYPIVSIEDGFAEDDWDGWKLITEKLGTRVQLVGDDLFVTNKERLARGIEKKVANSILIKLNQIGTLTEPSTPFAWQTALGTRRSSRTARARQRTRSSRICGCHECGSTQDGKPQPQRPHRKV